MKVNIEEVKQLLNSQCDNLLKFDGIHELPNFKLEIDKCFLHDLSSVDFSFATKILMLVEMHNSLADLYSTAKRKKNRDSKGKSI